MTTETEQSERNVPCSAMAWTRTSPLPGRIEVPDMVESPQHRLLERAIQQLGVPKLAARLKVDRSAVESWRQGEGEMPHAVLLALADVIEDLHEP